MPATPESTTATPFVDNAEDLWHSGLGDPLLLPVGKKSPPPDHKTGRDAEPVSWPDVMTWMEESPEGNIGLHVRKGIVGIDVDMYDGKRGRETLAAWEDRHGALPPTLMSTSREDGSGIRWYRVPEDAEFKGVIGPGIEVIQNHHRYAVWRGSVHPQTGATYFTIDQRTGEVNGEVNAATLPHLPETWISAMQISTYGEMVFEPYAGTTYESLSDNARRKTDEYVQQRVERVLDNLRAARTWKVGETDALGRGWEKLCADAAQTLRTLARDGWSGLNENTLFQRYVSAAPTDATWTTHDVAAKWRSQTKPAINGGRILPPSFDEMVTELAEQVADEVGDDDQNAPIDWEDLLNGEDVPPNFLVGRMVEHGQQAALVGAAKVGKSLLSLDWAVCMAAGKPFLGDEAREPVRVLYIDQENNKSDLRRRLRALGYGPEDLTNLTYLSFPMIGALDTIQGAAALRAEIDRFNPQVVFLDTVSRMISGPESDSDTWLALYRLTLRYLKSLGIATIRLDHFGKDTERGARGSSAKEQDVDQVWELRAAGKTTFDLKRTHSRTGTGEEFIRFDRKTNEEKTYVRHERPEREVAGLFFFEEYSATVLNAVKVLDDAGAPVDWGRDRLKKFSIDQGLGLGFGTSVWEQVVKCRKEVAERESMGS